MPGAVRATDLCTGHGPPPCFWPPRPTKSQNQVKVFVNNLLAVNVGSLWAEHSCVETHGSVQATGSPDVFVGGTPLARIGDQIACGSQNAMGSINVFVNGGGPSAA